MAKKNKNYETVHHPSHYGGDTIYETVKVIEAWGVGKRSETAGFNIGTVLKHISRAGLKPDSDYLEDLRKAKWYLQHEIDKEKARRK